MALLYGHVLLFLQLCHYMYALPPAQHRQLPVQQTPSHMYRAGPFGPTSRVAASTDRENLEPVTGGSQGAARGKAPVTMILGHVDAATSPTLVPNVFNSISSWSPSSFAISPPPGLAAQYPFLQYAQLFTATGGCYVGFPGCTSTRDLFNNPSIGLPSGVNASTLFGPLHNILQAGMIPWLVTGTVPISLSGQPKLGTFGFNTALPTSFSAYREYIALVTGALLSEFGIQEVRRWRFGVLTEFNNADWLNATASAYDQLYDYTVCGLEDAFGSSDFLVGVHACGQCDAGRSWNLSKFLSHAATGVSACSGRRVHLNWTGSSFYETNPSMPGDLSDFQQGALSVLANGRTAGLDTSLFGIDEGRVLFGPDGFRLVYGAVGAGFQASFDALLFKLLVSSGCEHSYYSRWGANAANGLFCPAESTVDNVATNVARLAYRMAGSQLIHSTNISAGVGLATPGSVVDGVLGLRHGPAGNSLQALVFHHHAGMQVENVSSVKAIVHVCGIAGAGRSLFGGQHTRLGNRAANFWPLFWEDQARANLSHASGDYLPGLSPYSDSPPLSSSRALKMFGDNLVRYQHAARLTSTPLSALVDNSGCVRFDLDLPPHEVSFVEIPV